ncbi:MAG: hypothetical protein C5B47_00640 [Verrucomicrobia bacterium]|nr:MAG: hypothetical protein C5B47_00640 [Verrucomicrobiota bacterium]
MKTKVINLLGGSGLGKSTTAALLFGELKLLGKQAELVREYVKEWAWEGKPVGVFGQNIIYGQQLARESMLYGKVEYIVTDSPLILAAIYQKFYTGKDTIAACIFNDLESAKLQGVEHINIVLRRNKVFDPRGRYETEAQARMVDVAVVEYLKANNQPFIFEDGDDRARIQNIIKAVVNE